jgi:cell wall-associated NlpC family hydrolase
LDLQMTERLQNPKTIEIRRGDQEFSPEARFACEVINIPIDTLKIAPTSIVEEAIRHAQTITSAAIEKYYENPDAASIPASKISSIFTNCMREVSESVDGTQLGSAIQQSTAQPDKQALYEKQAKTIVGLYLFGARMHASDAVHAITRPSPERYNQAAKVFEVHGFELPDFESIHKPGITEPVTPVRSSKQNMNRAIAIASATAVLAVGGIAGPAAAAENNGSGNNGNGNGNGSGRAVAEQTITVQPDGTTIATPTATVVETAPAASVTQIEQPTPAAPDKTIASPEIPASVNGTSAQSSQPEVSVSPVDTTTSTAEILPSGEIKQTPDAAPSQTHQSDVGTPNPDIPSQAKPSDVVASTPDTAPPQAAPETPVPPVASVPAPDVSQVPASPEATGDSPVVDLSAIPDLGPSATQDTAVAAEVLPTVTPDLSSALDRLKKAVDSGSLNDLANNPSDVYAAKDPAHPDQTLTMPMSDQTKQQVLAKVSILQGVMAGDPDVMKVITDYFAQNPVDAQTADILGQVINAPFTKDGHKDLSTEQKMSLVLLLSDINKPLLDQANATIAKATADYQAAQAKAAAEAAAQAKLAADAAAQAAAAAAAQSSAPSGSSGSSVETKAGIKLEIQSPVLESHLSSSELHKLQANIPFYIQEQEKSGIPWQVFAAVHYKEHGFSRTNPGNRQGLFQLYSTGINFAPGVHTSDSEFMRQLDLVANFLKHKAATIQEVSGSIGMNMSDDFVKELFCQYNGCPSMFRDQATALGYKNHAEGSPYVMNFADAARTPGASNWNQYRSDGGNIGPANSQLGAWIVYKQLQTKVSISHIQSHEKSSLGQNQENRVFTDNIHLEIPNAGAIVQRAEKLASLSMSKANFEPICPNNKDKNGHYVFCQDLCDHVAAYVWGNDHSYHHDAYLHWKSVEKNPQAIVSTDRNPPIGAFMFWGSGQGHVAIYLGDNKILTTDLYNKREGKTGGLYIAKATDVEKLWGLQYHGWAVDPVLMHTTAQVN